MCQAFPRNSETVLSCFDELIASSAAPAISDNASHGLWKEGCSPIMPDENALTTSRPRLNFREHSPVLESQ
jgi:hypothetical protein